MNPTQINQGGAQNQEKQPSPDPDKSAGELTEGRPHNKPEDNKAESNKPAKT